MPITKDELEASRHKPSYRAGIWALRVMIALPTLQLVLSVSGVVHDISTLVLIGFLAAMISGYVLLERAGVPVTSPTERVWRLRMMIYKDVFGLGRRQP